jgi:pimeloyl-ACP methyl ester carboxylesterase
MESLYLPQWQAFLRYMNLPGDLPVHVYISGLGGAALPTFAHILRYPGLGNNQALLVDLLGHGYSDQPDRFDYALESHANTVALLLEHLGLSACSVIGFSMGGAVAITLAAQRPDLVARLVVVEGNLDPGGGSVSRGIAAQSEEEFARGGYAALLDGLRTAGQGGDALAATVAGMFQVAAPHALHRSAVALVRGTEPTMRKHLLQLAMPRCYLFGEHTLPDPDTEFLPAQGIPVLTVPDAGHGMMWENPAGFASVLQKALALS